MPKTLPEPVAELSAESEGFAVPDADKGPFEGGERAALSHLETYFSSESPGHY